jgi:hypothetical protein
LSRRASVNQGPLLGQSLCGRPPRDVGQFRRGTTEAVFIEWDRNLIWVSTHAGLYCLSAPFLGPPVLEPMAVAEWSVPHVNVGREG